MSHQGWAAPKKGAAPRTSTRRRSRRWPPARVRVRTAPTSATSRTVGGAKAKPSVSPLSGEPVC